MKAIARYFTKNNGEGNFAILDGPPGSGKTNLTCLIIESLIKDFKFDIMTNIKFNERTVKTLPKQEQKIYKKIHYTPSFSEFLGAFVKIKGKSVTIIDDAQVTMGSSKTSTSKKGQYNDKFAMYIRKFGTNLYYVSHIPEYIPRYIYSQPHLTIQKPSRYDVIFEGNVYNPVPKTNLVMETYHPPSWEYDINLDALLRVLSLVSQDDMKKTIAKFLKDKKDNHFDFSDSDRIRVILEFLGPDLGKTYTAPDGTTLKLNQSEMAKRLGVSKMLISKIKNEILSNI